MAWPGMMDPIEYAPGMWMALGVVAGIVLCVITIGGTFVALSSAIPELNKGEPK